jgi:hypothetical protein
LPNSSGSVFRYRYDKTVRNCLTAVYLAASHKGFTAHSLVLYG